MTKEEFDNYKGLLHCRTCGHDVLKIHINYKKVYKNGDIARCNVCEWIKRHNGVPTINGFSKDEILIALYFLLYEKSIYINDLADELGRSLNDTIDLFQALKIGNKKCLVKVICEYCGKEIIKSPNVYKLSQNSYCSLECYWKDKTNKMDHGEESQFYNRITTNCTNCGKEIKIIPYNYKKTNSFGDNHNFCCQECYWEYRKKYYVGEKSTMINYQYTEDQLEKIRNNILKNSRSSKRFDSNIQLSVNNILEKNKINYEREYIVKYYAIDNYLTDYNLMIEVMGDYWHVSPLKYNENKYLINKTQQNGLLHDKQKHTYIKTHNNIEILYLWENDINNNIELCEKLILKYINNNGKLENYHSFNWELKDGNLFLCNQIIIPYQDMKSDDYRHLLKNN